MSSPTTLTGLLVKLQYTVKKVIRLHGARVGLQRQGSCLVEFGD